MLLKLIQYKKNRFKHVTQNYNGKYQNPNYMPSKFKGENKTTQWKDEIKEIMEKY